MGRVRRLIRRWSCSTRLLSQRPRRCRAKRHSSPFCFISHSAGIALEAVGDDLARVAGVLPAESTLEEALRCLLVPLGAEQKVDRLAGAVDRSVQVAPLPVDPDVSLVNVPWPTARTQVAA